MTFYSDFFRLYTSRASFSRRFDLKRTETHFATAKQLLVCSKHICKFETDILYVLLKRKLYWLVGNGTKTHIPPIPQGTPPSHTKTFLRPMTPSTGTFHTLLGHFY